MIIVWKKCYVKMLSSVDSILSLFNIIMITIVYAKLLSSVDIVLHKMY